MERQGDEIHVNTTEASGGITRHGVRYVLAISLLLAIAFLSAVWIIGAYVSADKPEGRSGYQGVAAETR
ncbi:MAG: hypothetical protein R3E09_05750 [Novosphingobium sp.]|nr:hypothetical protein [Novosphingobium sp.]